MAIYYLTKENKHSLGTSYSKTIVINRLNKSSRLFRNELQINLTNIENNEEELLINLYYILYKYFNDNRFELFPSHDRDVSEILRVSRNTELNSLNYPQTSA